MSDETPQDEEPRQDLIEPARAEIEATFRRRFGAVIQGAADDVELYAYEMSVDLTYAAAVGDERAIKHLSAQAEMLGEKHRLAASRAAWGLLSDFIFDVGKILAVTLRTI